MRRIMGICFLVFPLICCLWPKASFARDFTSPDAKLVAIVSPIKGDEGKESQVQIRRENGDFLCATSYGSQDGQHGEIVDQAIWTPDSQFFVFSMYSSGGHQPWHSPIMFYSRFRNSIHLIDGNGLITTDGHFRVSPPSFLEVFGHSNSTSSDTWIRLNLAKTH
jgi:hypothetical protein